MTDTAHKVAMVLDVGQANCSELILRIFETMKPLAAGDILQVSGYDPSAAVDIMAWCRQTGNRLVHYTFPVSKDQPTLYFIEKKE